MKDLRGRLTVVLTPELRALALEHLRRSDYADDGESLMLWFSVAEAPTNTVLDAAYSEVEALMIVVIARAVNELYEPVEAPDPDAEIRILTRH